MQGHQSLLMLWWILKRTHTLFADKDRASLSWHHADLVLCLISAKSSSLKLLWKMSTNCWASELWLNMQIFRHLLHEREGCKILQWTKCWLNNFEPQCCEWGWSLSKDSLHDFCKMFWSWIATQGSPKVSHWKCRWTVAKHQNLVIALSVPDLGWKTPLTTFAKCAEAGLQQSPNVQL